MRHDVAASGPAPGILDPAEAGIYRKVVWRLMPILLISYFVAYIDRSNIGFAKLQMQGELGLSNAVYGFGAGVFFIGYVIFEVPSNLFLHRIGARVWMTRIMVSWGILSALMYRVEGPLSFYALRFLLGAAEAGFLPGDILYLGYWFPSRRRARMVALFYSAVPVSGIIGGPLSGWIMKNLDKTAGLSGWQWMFLLEGIPSVLLAVVLYLTLDDNPQKAGWLTDAERTLITSQLAAEEPQHAGTGALSAFRDYRIWVMSLCFFFQVAGIVGLGLWLPTVVQATGVKDVFEIGLLSAIPYLIAIVVMNLNSWHSDRTGERRWHIAVPMALSAAGFALSTQFGGNTTVALACLTVATSALLCATPPFWTQPAALLSGPAAAAGIAMVSALGNVGGFVSPFFIGYTRDLTGNTSLGFVCISVGMLIGAGLALTFGRSPAPGVASGSSRPA